MSAVLECVVFGLASGVARDEFVAAAADVTEWAATQPGFESRELFETGDGRWIDVVRWATMGDAVAAADRIARSAACGPFLAMIDGSSVQVLHGRPVAPGARA